MPGYSKPWLQAIKHESQFPGGQLSWRHTALAHLRPFHCSTAHWLLGLNAWIRRAKTDVRSILHGVRLDLVDGAD